MVSKQQKRKMIEYFADRLKYPNIKVEDRLLVPCISFDNGIVILVTKEVGNKPFREMYSILKKRNKDVGVVFLKDGETFFRSAKEKVYKKLDKSLKHYNYEDAEKIITLRPEEQYLFFELKRMLQYYQPIEKEGLISYEFEEILFDYYHINPRERFRPDNTYSKKLVKIVKEEFYDGNLKLINGYLKKTEDLEENRKKQQLTLF